MSFLRDVWSLLYSATNDGKQGLSKMSEPVELADMVENRLKAVASLYHTNTRWLRLRLLDYFGRLDFSGLNVLEVGAGNGLYACCVASLGAKHIIALEPEAEGSGQAVGKTLVQNAYKLGLTNLKYIPCTLQDFTTPTSSLDLIYMLAVVNHLDEKHVQTLHSDERSRSVFQHLLRPVWEWLKPGGMFVLTDASRHHAYEPLIRLKLLRRHPFQPAIEWEKHQPPRVWQNLLQDLGYYPVEFHWATNWRYPWIPRLLVDNIIAAHLYSSLFVMRAHKPSQST